MTHAGGLQVLGRTSSINVRKVLWACAELGLAVAQREWGLPGLDLRSPEFLRLNPNGLVPVLVDGDFVLWESNSICRYLATRYGDGGPGSLLPVEPAARARVEQWMDWQATELNSAWRYAFMGLVRHSPAHADAAAQQASIDQWNRQMGLLDDALAASGGPHITGAAFTLADIVLGLSVHRWACTPFGKPELPQLQRYYRQTLAARPGFAARFATQALP